MIKKSLFIRLYIQSFLLLLLVAVGSALSTLYFHFSLTSIAILVAVFSVLLYFLVKWFLRPVNQVNQALADGIFALKDDDYSLSIHNEGYTELNDLVQAFNQLTQTMRNERLELSQRELLLEKVIQSTPVAIVLTQQDHVVYSNRASRELFDSTEKLEGQSFSALIKRLPASLLQASKHQTQGLISFSCRDQSVVYQLQCQPFHLHGKLHRLYLYQNLSREMSRKENELWKQLIRLISHELNNSLAPINSLTKSAKAILTQPEHYSMLDDILETIGRRTQHLHQFIDQYAQYARLPKPVIKPVEMTRFYQQIRSLCQIKIDCDCLNDIAAFDAVQLEQVILNLTKNAQESGSAAENIGMAIQKQAETLHFSVYDRGSGMTDAQLAQALLPFYTTKAKGTGIGLTLCNEIISAHNGKLRLFNRDHGGLCVSFSIPI